MRLVLLAAALVLAIAGCSSSSTPETPAAEAPMPAEWDGHFPLAEGVGPDDLAPYPQPPFELQAFNDFILAKPTFDEFRGAWPGILLVTPDMLVTMELRYDYTRFFPETDDDGRIVAGGFR